MCKINFGFDPTEIIRRLAIVMERCQERNGLRARAPFHQSLRTPLIAKGVDGPQIVRGRVVVMEYCEVLEPRRFLCANRKCKPAER